MSTLYLIGVGLHGKPPAWPAGATGFATTARLGVAGAVVLDKLYDGAEDFDALAQAVAERVCGALEGGDVALYTVAQPWEDAAARLCAERAGAAGHGIEAMAHDATNQMLCALTAACPQGLSTGVTLVTATQFLTVRPGAARAWLVSEVDNDLLAGEVKLLAGRVWGDEGACYRLEWQGAWHCQPLAVHEIDKMEWSPDVALFFPALPMTARAGYTADDLADIMALLRGPGGCPWDREQTRQSLRGNLIEECFEAVAALDAGDDEEFCDEMGDVLLQTVFHADIGPFDWLDVTTAISAKLILRHPHVFGEAVVADAAGVLGQWDAIKQNAEGKGLFDALIQATAQPGFTGLAKAMTRLGRRGVALPEADALWDDCVAAMAAFGNAPDAHTLGRLLWLCGWWATLAHIDADQALRGVFSDWVSANKIALEDGATGLKID